MNLQDVFMVKKNLFNTSRKTSTFWYSFYPKMIYIASFHFFCADHAELSQKHIDTVDLQRVLLGLAFERFPDEALQQLSKGKEMNDFCSWYDEDTLGHKFRVRCDSQILQSLTMYGVRLGNLNIEYLPSTIEYLSVEFCDQSYQLETRRLPRMIKKVQLSNNHIHGNIDLTALPGRLDTLSANMNDIRGEIFLAHLPPNLKWLSLSHNKIRQKTVYFHNLPPTLARVDVSQNNIKEVRPLTADSGTIEGMHFIGRFCIVPEPHVMPTVD